MDIFSFLTLFGGLAFFLYGMNTCPAVWKKWPAASWSAH
jgi:hypothetical protein